jgi:hypothetical protein
VNACSQQHIILYCYFPVRVGHQLATRTDNDPAPDADLGTHNGIGTWPELRTVGKLSELALTKRAHARLEVQPPMGERNIRTQSIDVLPEPQALPNFK